MSKKPFQIIAGTLLAIGLVGVGSLMLSAFVPFISDSVSDTSDDISSDTSSDSTDTSSDTSSEETPFDIVQQAQFVFGEIEYDDPADLLDGSYFGVIGEEYPLVYSSVFESDKVTTDYQIGDGDDSMVQIKSDYCWSTDVVIDSDYETWESKWSTYPMGTPVTSSSISKLCIILANESITNTYRVGLSIRSTGADLDCMLSDDLGHFENEFTFYHQEITYFEIPPGETYYMEHVPSTAACYIDAIYIYYF